MVMKAQLNRLYVGLLEQDHQWRTGEGRWVTIDSMLDDHLRHTMQYLLEHSKTYQDLAQGRYLSKRYGDNSLLTGTPHRAATGASERWMKGKPFFQALQAEWEKRHPERVYVSWPEGARWYEHRGSAEAFVLQLTEEKRFPITISDKPPKLKARISGSAVRTAPPQMAPCTPIRTSEERVDERLMEIQSRINHYRSRPVGVRNRATARALARDLRAHLDILEDAAK